MSSPSQIWRLVLQRSSTSSEIFRTHQDSLSLFVNVCHHLKLSHLLVLVIYVDTHYINPYWRVQNVPLIASRRAAGFLARADLDYRIRMES
jgi:hypothetical protein